MSATESPSKRTADDAQASPAKKLKTDATTEDADQSADVTVPELADEDFAEIDTRNILPDTGRRTRGKKYDFKALNEQYDGPEDEDDAADVEHDEAAEGDETKDGSDEEAEVEEEPKDAEDEEK